MIKGIAHVGIRVHSLARSREFYELLGFEFVVGPVGPEPVAILRHPAGVEINLILNAAAASTENVLMDVDTKHSGYTHVALEVSSVDDAVVLFGESGIPVTGGPIDYPNGARGVFVRDPDLNVVEFYQRAQPS